MKKIKTVILMALILIVTFLSFYPSLKNGFVNWDDNRYVTDAPVIKAVTLGNISKIFKSFFAANYQPVTMLSYLCEYSMHKLNPFWYHFDNLILHLMNCLLVFCLINLISGRGSAAFIAALFFGIHPLRAESVAWVSERKDLLYLLFYLWSMICYIYYVKKKNYQAYYYLSLIFFIFSLLSKSMAITLPVILLLIDWFLERRTDKRMFIEKIPYFILSFIIGAVAVVSQNSSGALNKTELFLRLANAAYSVIFYLYKILLPIKLSCFYPYDLTGNMPAYSYSLFVLIILVTGVVITSRYTKKAVFGSMFFLVTLIPVMQSFSVGIIVADRYTYAASIGIAYLIGEAFLRAYNCRIKKIFLIRSGLMAGLVVVLTAYSVLTFQRSMVWKDTMTLWSDALAEYPGSELLINNVGAEYSDRGKFDEALSHFNKALEINPDNAQARNNRGVVFFNQGKFKEASEEYLEAVRIDPYYSDAYVNLANLYYIQEDYQRAIKLLEQVTKINPAYIKAYDLLISIYVKLDNRLKIIGVSNKAVQIEPEYLNGYVNLCSAYGQSGDTVKAIACCRKAVELDSQSALAYSNLAAAWYSLQKYELAVKYCDKAAALGYKVNPEFLEVLKAFRR